MERYVNSHLCGIKESHSSLNDFVYFNLFFHDHGKVRWINKNLFEQCWWTCGKLMISYLPHNLLNS